MDFAWTGAFSTAVVVVLAVAVGIVACAVGASDRLGSVSWARVRFVQCPWRATGVTVEFREDRATGRAVDVRWCTTFIPVADVRCGRECLETPACRRTWLPT